ncbi:hypothetical protein QVD17_11141 [Tagetes erecta]|uniref:Hydroxyproline-rich glycoprotein family protein n=1 Tax=Tagetes erecta TaxID=13708 RepID=A0AAD8P6U9_TARER|nr:hypothetical protein QVD17_11141 [Tagetes erecta]
MDEYEEEPRSPPFWLETTKSSLTPSSIFFNSFVLIIFLLLFALISILIIIPSLIQFSSNIFRPSLVKRSWDSINLVLVLMALVFGFLSRNITSSNHEKLDFDNGYHRTDPELSTGAPIMYHLQDQSTNSAIGLRRQRTSVSYPDLRELSPPSNHYSDDPWRFSDDTHFNYYRVLETNRNLFRQQSTNPVKQKTKRVYRNVAVDDGERSSSASGTGNMLSPETESSEKNGGKHVKRRARSSEPKRLLTSVLVPVPDSSSPPSVSPASDAKKDFFTSFYHKKKKKRQRDRSVDNLGSLLAHSQPPLVKFPAPVPPPPPPPPLVQHSSLFPSKKENPKKFIAITLPPPSPPPPPPLTTTVTAARGGNYVPRASITRLAPFVSDKPGASLMPCGFNGIDDSSSGGESPMKRIPPPPPLPPFKMPDWKFAVEGDFVRLQSTLSSRSASPDGDEARSPSSDVDTAATAMELFFPSPDVDIKADSFIARFRAGLKLERMSKLGPGPGSGPNNS